ncbi:CinA family protein [Haploplasma axanthum]|nr:nicotinamide-nucleotide amidohydrolase family protein [Haploplasma axanthum]
MIQIIESLKEKHLKIAFAESMTGGYLSECITRHNGASRIFSGSIVAYTKDMKINILKVKSKTIDEKTVISNEVATEMVLGLKKLIEADIYISVTGNAGPTYDIGTNKFECYIGYLFLDEFKIIHHIFENNDRLANIKKVEKLIEEEIKKSLSIL